MAIDAEKLLNWPFPEVEQSYTQRDVMLYALGVGFGSEAPDAQQLSFVYEQNLQVMPSMCVVLGTPGFWIKDPASGITWQSVLHGEQSFELFKPLPAAGTIVATNRVRDVVDKGEGRGALLFVEREIFDKTDGSKLAANTSTYFCRADGGFGVSTCTPPQRPAVPSRAPDTVVELPIDPRAHLIYRLSGDYNPIHADPAAADKAGFPRPIFHGLGSLGVATRALLEGLCEFDGSRMQGLSLRFTSPVFPGETLQTEIWHEGGEHFFRCRVKQRDKVVLDNGTVTLRS